MEDNYGGATARMSVPFSVSPLVFFDYNFGPLRLTPYNNELFFSFDDGTGGHKLWVSDGTLFRNNPSSGNHDVILSLDYLSSQQSQPFPVLNNVLYLSGNDYTGEMASITTMVFTNTMRPTMMDWCSKTDNIQFRIQRYSSW